MGRELADIALRQYRSSDLVFVVDDPGVAVQGINVIGPDSLLADDQLCLGVGDPSARKSLALRFSHRSFATLISDTARMSPSAVLGEGSAVCDYSVVNNNTRIGSHFQCNVFSLVSHDCIIGDYVTFSPRVSCNGWVEIGDRVFVGAGAIIRNGKPDRRLRIGTGATIGMGAVVTKDVPDGMTVYGNPAREISRRDTC